MILSKNYTKSSRFMGPPIIFTVSPQKPNPKIGRKILEPPNASKYWKQEPLSWTEKALLDKGTPLVERTCRCLLCKFWEFSHWSHLAEWNVPLKGFRKQMAPKLFFFMRYDAPEECCHKHTAPRLSSVALFQQKSNNSRGFRDFRANPGMKHSF